jgi:Na+-driven multidrug efflux pump
VFSASDTAANLILFYTHWLVGAIFFNGSLFVANACFNNLGHPRWATAFNFGKVVLGVIPAVYLGSQWYGAKGVFAGEAIGSVAFGVLAMIAAFMLAKNLESNYKPAVPDRAADN